MNMNKYKLISLSLLIALTAILSGCNGNSDITNPPGSGYAYTLKGCFVQDLNLSAQKQDYNYFAATMTRNTLNLNSAQLFFGSSALIYGTEYNVTDSVYTFANSPTPYLASGKYVINIVDSTIFSDTTSSQVIDSLWILNAPDSTIPHTNSPIFVEWTPVLGVDGYIVAVVLTQNAYTGKGFSAYVTEAGTSTFIPTDAFRANPTQTLDTGWYDIYVYGYTGAPDSVLSSSILPAPLPSELPDNINQTKFTGHFGSIFVSRKTVVQIVAGTN